MMTYNGPNDIWTTPKVLKHLDCVREPGLEEAPVSFASFPLGSRLKSAAAVQKSGKYD